MPHYGASSHLPFNIQNILGSNKDSKKCCICANSNDIRTIEKCRCSCHARFLAKTAGVSQLSQKERKRTTFSPYQEQKMQQYFLEYQYIDANKRKKIAEELGLTESQIKRKWQNNRAKVSAKTKTMASMQLSTQPPPSSIMGIQKPYPIFKSPSSYPSYTEAGNQLSMYQRNLRQYEHLSLLSGSYSSMKDSKPFSSTSGSSGFKRDHLKKQGSLGGLQALAFYLPS